MAQHQIEQQMDRPLRIGYLLASPSGNPLASTRISVLNVLPTMRSAGIEAEIVFDPPSPIESPEVSHLEERLLQRNFSIVYFQKIRGQSVQSLVRRLSTGGVKSIYGVCDWVDPAMAELTDATIVVTDYLKNLYPRHLHHKIHVIHDGIERPDTYKAAHRTDYGSALRPLNAVLVTASDLGSLPILRSPPSWLRVTIVGQYQESWAERLRYARWTLQSMNGGARTRLDYVRFLTNPRISRKQWTLDGVYRELLAADIGIIPLARTAGVDSFSSRPVWEMKSENRLTLKMAAALPVVASPIPAYEAIVEQGQNAYLAATLKDWTDFLTALREPDLRRDMGLRARRSVIERFSTRRQTEELIALFRSLVRLVPGNQETIPPDSQ